MSPGFLIPNYAAASTHCSRRIGDRGADPAVSLSSQ